MASGSPALAPFLSHHLSGVAVGQVQAVLTREAEYMLNSRGPSLVPTVEELMRLYFSGFFDPTGRPLTNFAAFAIKHGADFSQARRSTPAGRERQLLWSGVLDLNKPRYPEALLRHMYRFAFAKNADQADALRQELIDKLRVGGIKDTARQNWYIDEKEAADVATLLFLFRVGLLGVADFQQAMSVHGLDNEDIGRIGMQRLYVPNPQDLLLASDRHAWEQAWADRWQLDADKPDQWGVWARRLGLDNPADTGRFGHDVQAPGDAENPTEGGEQRGANSPEQAQVTTWGDILWRVDQRYPTLSELMQFVHRFRGEPTRPETFSVPGVRPLTQDELNKFMDVLQVPNGLKTYYYTLFYTPPGKREIKAFIHTGATNPGEVAGWLSDSGMRPDIAVRQAQVLYAEEAERQLAPVKRLRDESWKGYVSAIKAAYASGAIDRPTAESGLSGNNVPADVIKVELDTIDIRTHAAIVEAVIRRTRSDWFAGRTDELEARVRMGKSGIAGDRIDSLIALWKATRGQGHQVASTAKVLAWFRKGYITRAAAIQRLSNLEWSKPDMLLLIAEVEAEMKQDIAKQLSIADRDKRTQVREAENALAKMTENASRIMAHLKKVRPKADVLKWYAAGQISEAEARQTLAFQGYDSEAIDLYLVNALDKAKGKPTSPKPPAKA